MKKKNDLLRNYSHFLQIAWNILLIWHNYDMFILMVITIGPIFVIILNFDRFKYWYCRPFFCQLDGFVCLQFMWVILVTTSTARAIVIVFLLSMFILLVSTFSVIFGVSAMLGFFSFFKLFAAFRRPEEQKNYVHIIVEEFKLEISLQDLLSEKPETRLSNVDANMIKHFSVNYESNICETKKINRINRERINTIIVALAVEVTTNITHMNPQQTKMTKKE